MTQSKALRTFEVHVEQCGNSTWQGKLTADGEVNWNCCLVWTDCCLTVGNSPAHRYTMKIKRK